jgi:very-short-patch-repair endonuclease
MAFSVDFVYFPIVDSEVMSIAERQAGAVCRAQVLAAGGSDRMISARLKSGRWLRTRCSGVYVVAGVRVSYLQRLWVAHLAAGPQSVISHESAAALERFTGFPRRQVVLTVDHPSHLHVPGAFVHQISDLEPRWVWSLDGLPVTVSGRTIVDLASVCSRARLAIVLDDALAAKRVTTPAVARCLFEVLRPGKRGLNKLVAILDERGPGYVAPASELERLLFAALRAGGLPDPIRQFRLPGRGAVDGLVDAAYPDAKLILEADGRRWHTRERDFPRDTLRRNEAARVGWQTLNFLWEELTQDPEGVADTVRDVRAQRLSSRLPTESVG